MVKINGSNISVLAITLIAACAHKENPSVAAAQNTAAAEAIEAAPVVSKKISFQVSGTSAFALKNAFSGSKSALKFATTDSSVALDCKETRAKKKTACELNLLDETTSKAKIEESAKGKKLILGIQESTELFNALKVKERKVGGVLTKSFEITKPKINIQCQEIEMSGIKNYPCEVSYQQN